MRSAISLAIWFACAAHAAAPPYFSVLSENPGGWPALLGSVGLQQRPAVFSNILVARKDTAASPEWIGRVEAGAVLILEGESPVAAMFGFRRTSENVRAQSITDTHDPQLAIIWEKPLELPIFETPPGAQVFAREKWTGAPMTAGMRRAAGAVLWVAADPGERGYERFPYLLNALGDLGVEPPFRSSRLWTFFDSSYRLRVDLDYFAARWREAGISALHVAAWHYFEPDPVRDEYLAKLIAACHREGILVYAWLELPHVSEKFWDDHPEWREKTALQQDAQLDWRKLMNLANRDCFRAASSGVKQLMRRFDWDGVNLAELYFESLEGIGNPSRFTPMNADVREMFRVKNGFDPVELFGARNDEASRQKFLDFRAGLAISIEEEWLGEIESLRHDLPDLDITLTHVDDRLDPAIRSAIGADAARVLPLLEQRKFTFLIEDPATTWNLGPERYQTLAAKYAELTPHREKLAIDLNIVERYQDVYPTKQQTGAELFQLVHHAAAGFARVALYFESSLRPADLGLLSSAAAAVRRFEISGAKTLVESDYGAGVPWDGPADVDGHAWPASDGKTVWLPAGAHTIEKGSERPGSRLLRLNGDLKTARLSGDKGIEFTYASSSRAIAVLSAPPRRIRIDGVEQPPKLAGPNTLMLPSGEHAVIIETQ